MRLVLVPRVQTADPDGFVAWRPLLPAALDRPHGWGQASSEFEVDGRVLCWVRATSAELDEIAAAGGRVSSVCPDAESDRMVAAMRAGDLKSSRDEFVAAYREPAAAEESLARAERGIARVEWLIATVGLLAAAALLGVTTGALLGLGVLHADNFNRANETLGASGMSDGLGTWTVGGGTWDVVSNECRGTAAGYAYDSAMAAVGVSRATAKGSVGLVHDNIGPTVRVQAGGNSYVNLLTAARKSQLYRYTAGFNALGSNGASIVGASDTFAVDASGTSISGLVNAAVECGPVTDATYATGVMGARTAAANRKFDNWQAEVASGNPWYARLNY